jgi:hypothetical protein
MTTATPPVAAEPQYPVRLEVDYPERLSRGLVLVKWLLVIPHLAVIWFLMIGMLTSMFVAWWAILFTGRYPRTLFDYTVGVQQWMLRVNAYSQLMVTDQYPPFSLGRSSAGVAFVMAVLGLGLLVGFFMLWVVVVFGVIAAQGTSPYATPAPR